MVRTIIYRLRTLRETMLPLFAKMRHIYLYRRIAIFALWSRVFRTSSIREKGPCPRQTPKLNAWRRESFLYYYINESPYSNIRKEAYHFLEDKLQPVGDPRHAFQRNLLEGSLRFFLQDLDQRGKDSSVYQDFFNYFLNSDWLPFLIPCFPSVNNQLNLYFFTTRTGLTEWSCIEGIVLSQSIKNASTG